MTPAEKLRAVLSVTLPIALLSLALGLVAGAALNRAAETGAAMDERIKASNALAVCIQGIEERDKIIKAVWSDYPGSKPAMMESDPDSAEEWCFERPLPSADLAFGNHETDTGNRPTP